MYLYMYSYIYINISVYKDNSLSLSLYMGTHMHIYVPTQHVRQQSQSCPTTLKLRANRATAFLQDGVQGLEGSGFRA